MALEVGSYAPQIQTSTVNPLQQRSDEQSKRAEQKSNESARAETRVQGSSSAESQRSALVQTQSRNSEERTESSGPKQRGSLVDLSV
jgi:hypothetical protein